MWFENWLRTMSLRMQDGLKATRLIMLVAIGDRARPYISNFCKIRAVELVEERQNVELLGRLEGS